MTANSYRWRLIRERLHAIKNGAVRNALCEGRLEKLSVDLFAKLREVESGLVCQVDIKRQHLCPNTAASHQATCSHCWADVSDITNTFIIYWAKNYKKCLKQCGRVRSVKYAYFFLFRRMKNNECIIFLQQIFGYLGYITFTRLVQLIISAGI